MTTGRYPRPGARATLAPMPLLALAVLQVADVLTTLAGLSRGATEAGAIAGPALGAFGVAGLIFAPLAGVAVQLYVLARMPRQFRRAGWAAVLAVACIPIVNNAAVLL
jgi:uncharacterized protein YqgC (DUF456 family)